MTLKTDSIAFGEGEVFGLAFPPKRFRGLIPIGSRFMERLFVLAERGVDFGDDVSQSKGSSQGLTRRDTFRSVGGFGLFQTGFDPLKCFDAFTFQITFARACQNRLGRKTILNRSPSFMDSFSRTCFRHCHAET